jgi:hypothetical protein
VGKWVVMKEVCWSDLEGEGGKKRPWRERRRRVA